MFPDDPQARETVHKLFPNIGESMFLLFVVMNADMGPIEGLFEEAPNLRYLFCGFVIVGNWALLAIFTAVVSENMMHATEERRQEEEKLESQQKSKRSVIKLNEIFDRLDENLNAEITKDDWDKLMSDKDVKEELMDATGLAERDLEDMFRILSTSPTINGVRVIKKSDFVDSLQKENKPASERSMMRFEKRIANMEDRVRDWARARGAGSMQLSPTSRPPSVGAGSLGYRR
eukprot:TRINITY_DN10042_c0_g1_i9.p1 TRINITY_DN10042_c0_g1~~TRINITY_DN10042_c0_g1_i9.p1  ORF type:complete len:232 (+),score=46.90 TRINITY_DN10042_c0_g1_i9:2-697(+)